MNWSWTLGFYLARQFLSWVMIVFGGFLALSLSLDLADLFSRTPQTPIPSGVVFGMSLLNLGNIGQKVMPFSVLLGGMAAFFRQSRTHELVVARAMGISAWQILTPPLLVAVTLGVLSMTVFNPIAASFLAQYERLDAKYIRGQESQLALSRNGLWLRQGDANHQSVVHATGVSNKGVRLKDVIVFLYCGLDNACGRIDAESAKLQDHTWRLTNAWVSGADGHPEFHATYDQPTDLTPAGIEESFASPETVSFWDLPRFIATAEQAGFSASRHRLYWYSLLALPILFAAMVFMAASFSMRLARLGGVVRLVLSGAIGGFVVYFLGDVMSALGEAGTLPAPLAAVAPAAVAILLGMTLLFHHEDG